MKIYESVLTVVFLLLTAACGWAAWKTCRQARVAEDGAQRKAVRRKALLWVTLGLMFAFGALFILFRAPWFLGGMALLGFAALGWSIGAGVGANMREH